MKVCSDSVRSIQGKEKREPGQTNEKGRETRRWWLVEEKIDSRGDCRSVL